ncbi:MAG: TGS domain-containing protein [Dehalococcoidales bacterium]|nr:TGS domain-containing protein [Dehalococcoidales bacterium]
MPANLPPHYYVAEEAFRQAKTTQEKVEALETMLAIMPKHKGTDHLKADLRAKLAKLTEEGERRKGGVRASLYSVRKEGAAQLALIGPPNVGKSQLMGMLTDAEPKVGIYPFTTQLPQPAMAPVDNVQLQLVDLPPVAEDVTPNWLRSIARQCDLLLLVVDLSFDPLSDIDLVMAELAKMRLEPVASAREEGMSEEMVLRKRALVVANKCDAPDAPDNLELLNMQLAGRLPVVAVSATTGANLEELKRRAYEVLDIIRVYTRAPDQDVDRRHPFVLPEGSTIADIAESVHRDLARQMKYALVWGSGKFSGQRVSRDYVLADEDVVEIVT